MKEEELLKREEEDRLKKEEEERLKREEEDRLKKEEEEGRLRKEEEAARLKREAEERILKEEAEQLRRKEEAHILKEKVERLILKIEEQRLIMKEEKEQFRLEEEERVLKEEEARLRHEEEEYLREEEEKRLRRIEEERASQAKREADESVRLKKTTPSIAPSPVPESENLLLQDLVNLIQSALDIKMDSKMYQRWIKGWDKVVQVYILNEGFVYVLIKDNQMKAALGKPPREPDIVMEGEYKTITNYLNGELDPIQMFFDLILLRKMRLVKGLEIKLSNILSGNIVQQARDLYRIDRILKIK